MKYPEKQYQQMTYKILDNLENVIPIIKDLNTK